MQNLMSYDLQTDPYFQYSGSKSKQFSDKKIPTSGSKPVSKPH